MENNKRRFTRVDFKVRAEMTVNDTHYRADEISNLSVGGCLMPITGEMASGDACAVKIFLSGASSELEIQVDGEIIRSASGETAVKFTGIDPDSLYHLQNIILYNSEDPGIVERELNDHPGIV
ncbi:MAG: PilZ domain-containing protein [Desulfobacterales bacterium]|nr:PilZ domain-containing protein [Desulfobacterales bacterium]